MTYSKIKEIGTKIVTEDIYDGFIYLFTREYWGHGDKIYCHEEHPNANKYTGKTETYYVGDTEEFKKRNNEGMGINDRKIYEKICGFLGVTPRYPW